MEANLLQERCKRTIGVQLRLDALGTPLSADLPPGDGPPLVGMTVCTGTVGRGNEFRQSLRPG
jgi:hypothetical protein